MYGAAVGRCISSLERERFMVVVSVLLALSLLLCRGRDVGCFALVVVAKLPSCLTNASLNYQVEKMKNTWYKVPLREVPRGMAQGHMIIIITIIIFLTLLLPSFWTSRGHRCHPFFPPVLAFNFYRA